MPIMRPWKRRLVSVTVALAFLTPLAPVSAGPDVSFTGSGWGHGVGLSQYGAKAMGADGASWREIIDRYYTGVAVGSLGMVAPESFVNTDPDPLWVGLLQDSESVTFSVETGTARLCFDVENYCSAIATTGETWRFGPDTPDSCAFQRVIGQGVTLLISRSASCAASVRPDSASVVIALPFKARSYDNGTIRFRKAVAPRKFHTAIEMGIDDYMKGLAVVPESWAAASLEAQAVAVRSNALWHALDRGAEGTFGATQQAACSCNLYDASPDQVFQGYTGEIRHPNWVAAVDATAMQVMGWGATVALGEFTSSSGGWTENYSDVFGGTAHSYLASVNDSAAYADSAANPHQSWGAGSNQASLALAFGFSWVSDLEVVSRNASGSAAAVLMTGIRDGRPVSESVSAVDVRSALSLRSTTFDVTVTPRFSDVPTTHQFAGEVLGLDVLKITTGCTATAFCPTGQVTREEMAAFLVRALALPQASGDTFGDDDGSFFEADIEALVAAGITDGCSASAFCPDAPVTRSEMAAFIARGFKLSQASGDTFGDDDGSFFEADIEALVAAGITDGCSASAFCPDAPVTRSEMAAFIVRALAVG